MHLRQERGCSLEANYHTNYSTMYIHYTPEQATWEYEEVMRPNYPTLFQYFDKTI